MDNLMEYKGYHAKIEYSDADKMFFGKVLGINDTLIFGGDTVPELEAMFHENIDDYLELCAEEGREPDKEYKGSFNVRIDPSLHKAAVFEAERRNISLNKFIEESVQTELNKNTQLCTIVMPVEYINSYVQTSSPVGALFGDKEVANDEEFMFH